MFFSGKRFVKNILPIILSRDKKIYRIGKGAFMDRRKFLKHCLTLGALGAVSRFGSASAGSVENSVKMKKLKVLLRDFRTVVKNGKIDVSVDMSRDNSKNVNFCRNAPTQTQQNTFACLNIRCMKTVKRTN